MMRELYNKLIGNLRIIERTLPAHNQFGTYSPIDLVSIRAYYILCHAEFEYFFEECATKKINMVMREYNRSATPHMLLLSLTFAFIKSDEDVLDAKKNSTLNRLLNIMRTKYQKSVLDINNGIKENNLVDIYSPLGIDIYSILDVDIIAELNALGVKRGDFAHKALHLNSIEDTLIAVKRTHKIARGLRKFYTARVSKRHEMRARTLPTTVIRGFLSVSTVFCAFLFRALRTTRHPTFLAFSFFDRQTLVFGLFRKRGAGHGQKSPL